MKISDLVALDSHVHLKPEEESAADSAAMKYFGASGAPRGPTRTATRPPSPALAKGPDVAVSITRTGVAHDPILTACCRHHGWQGGGR